MSSFSGNYGKVLIGSDEVAEVASWWVELNDRPPLKDWVGGFEADIDQRSALIGDLRTPLTLQLYSGNDDSEPSYLTGQANIKHVPLGRPAVSVSFEGTGPLEFVDGDERRIL